ncbi:hypothetical protein BC833DRAFT_596308 [Globomyces pollinis-pini]|nr:hypothetical protein BC833DRAFT_596308 [Globomyces pollinis-pini]
MTETKEKEHWVIFAFWAYSHFKPTVELALKLIQEKHVQITFVIERHPKINKIIDSKLHQDLNFFELPKSWEIEPDHDLFLQNLVKVIPSVLETINNKLKIDYAVFEMYTCVAYEAILPYKIPFYSFFTVNGFAVSYMLATTLHKDLLTSVTLPVKVEREDAIQSTVDLPLIYGLNSQFRGPEPTPGVNDVYFYFQEECRYMSKFVNAVPKVILNSFPEFEPKPFDCIDKLAQKFIHVGPLGLSDPPELKNDETLEWLDSKPNQSVLYIAFGTEFKIKDEEIKNICEALIETNQYCIWAIREPQDTFVTEQVKRSERIRIVGWAPQVHILNHPSTGAFLSHCGWNSCVETLSAGKPVICWPIFAEQYLNALVIVEKGLGKLISGTGMRHSSIISTFTIVDTLKDFFDNIEGHQKVSKIVQGQLQEFVAGQAVENIRLL